MIDNILKISNCKVSTGIYIVSTPIGNLKDITLRAIDVLKSVSIIVCEDTRVSSKLLKLLNINTKTLSYHDYSNDMIREKIYKLVELGNSVALISDAGTPLISDPGFKLIRDALNKGINVTPIPGVSAPIAALSASGLPSDIFTFLGFLPSKKSNKNTIISNLNSSMGTILIFENAKRIENTLSIINNYHSIAQVVIARELTKKYEQFIRGEINEIISLIKNMPKKGEIVLLLSIAEKETNILDIDNLLKESLLKMSLKDSVTYVTNETGVSKRIVYNKALELNKKW